MKKRHLTFTIFLLLSLIVSITSCENYRDNNGDFGGMWQLTQWQTRGHSGQIDSTIATNQDGIYYSIQRSLIQFTMCNDSINTYNFRLYAYFTLTSDSLRIYNVAKLQNDSVSLATLASYGVPANGSFHVDALSSDKMVLSYPNNRLFFRKY